MSPRSVSDTLLNLCLKELRQFWRKKWVQPSTSKVYLIKWLVSVYVRVLNILYLTCNSTGMMTLKVLISETLLYVITLLFTVFLFLSFSSSGWNCHTFDGLSLFHFFLWAVDILQTVWHLSLTRSVRWVTQKANGNAVWAEVLKWLIWMELLPYCAGVQERFF